MLRWQMIVLQEASWRMHLEVLPDCVMGWRCMVTDACMAEPYFGCIRSTRLKHVRQPYR